MYQENSINAIKTRIESMGDKNRLFLNSRGLNETPGTFQIKTALSEYGEENLSEKTIYIVSFPEYEVDEKILKNCIEILGFQKENVRFSRFNFPDFKFVPDFIYVTAGNTFEVLHYMRKYCIDNYIKEVMKNETTIYIGSSAGAMIAGSDLRLCTDRDYEGMYDMSALELFKGAIIPHCTQEKLKRYLAVQEKHVMESYPVIYSVSDKEVVILDMEKDEA